ncbi:GntR family transcriptional regulator [Streptomyces sp. 796.1]|uniref:GntR family transcriptional regulator n=1 Tax=Streptomyces sp. 796.1 TaxID=3163029 RepID=UPI0039C9563D
MSDRAAYRRIAAAIEARVRAGHWRPGDQMPSRREFASIYGVHEQTVRLAVALLRRQGILEGAQRARLTVAYPPAVRALIRPDADWPHNTEIIAGGTCPATPELAERLTVPVGAMVRYESCECWDPDGRSAMLMTTWWPGARRPHATAVCEVETVLLPEQQAHALGLTVDTAAYRVVRTRLDDCGRPVSTADLILPMDRWVVRFRA